MGIKTIGTQNHSPITKLLNALFPKTPIVLTRIDGHAILGNQAALDFGNVTIDSKMMEAKWLLKITN